MRTAFEKYARYLFTAAALGLQIPSGGTCCSAAAQEAVERSVRRAGSRTGVLAQLQEAAVRFAFGCRNLVDPSSQAAPLVYSEHNSLLFSRLSFTSLDLSLGV